MFVSEPARTAPLWSLGFRPFFLLGSLFACLAVWVWGGWLFGLLPGWQPPGGMLAWHRHEMPFGFCGAIIAGFLLTAVPNWTGRPGLCGKPLMVLVGLWSIARLGWLVPLHPALFLMTQLAFLPVLAWVLGQQLIAARKRNNYPILGVLALMALCEGLTLSGILLGDEVLQRRGALAVLWLIAALMTVIGGRVIPFFIQRGLGLETPAAPFAKIDVLLLIGTLLAAASIGFGFNDHPQSVLAALYLLLAVLHVMRLCRWYEAGIWRVPLLWSLFVAYAWIPVAAFALALWHGGLLPMQSLASHALAVGGVGGMILAMIARVSLGHTGRPLQPAKVMTLAFVAMNLAAVSRIVVTPFFSAGLAVSSLLWGLAFILFLFHYTRILCGPRLLP